MQNQDTHSKVIGYLLWIFGFMGAHRFYYGRQLTGTLWFFYSRAVLHRLDHRPVSDPRHGRRGRYTLLSR